MQQLTCDEGDKRAAVYACSRHGGKPGRQGSGSGPGLESSGLCMGWKEQRRPKRWPDGKLNLAAWMLPYQGPSSREVLGPVRPPASALAWLPAG